MDATRWVKEYEGSKTCAAVLTSHFQVCIMLTDTIFGVITTKIEETSRGIAGRVYER